MIYYSGFTAEVNICGHLGQTNCKEFYSIKNKYQYTTVKYLYINSKFDYDNPGAEPTYEIKDMDIYLGYYGTWYYTHKLFTNEVVKSNTTSYIFDSDARYTNFLYVNSYQVAKVELKLDKEFDRYTIYSPSSFLSSNPNPGVLIQTASSGLSSVSQMLIVLCLFSQVGGLYFFMRSLLFTVLDTFNRKMFQTEVVNLLRFMKTNSNSLAPEYEPNDFNLSRRVTKVKPVLSANQNGNSIKNEKEVGSFQ